MQELLQREDLFKLIISGVKEATIINGTSDIVEGPLLIKEVNSGKTKEVNVTDIEFIKYSELNGLDVQTNGFENLDDLKSTLSEIYGKLDLDQDITIVYWN